MTIKYAVIRRSAYEAGKIFIAPPMVLDDERLAHDRAQFSAEAYKEAHVVLELRPIEAVKGR